MAPAVPAVRGVLFTPVLLEGPAEHSRQEVDAKIAMGARAHVRTLSQAINQFIFSKLTKSIEIDERDDHILLSCSD